MLNREIETCLQFRILTPVESKLLRYLLLQYSKEITELYGYRVLL